MSRHPLRQELPRAQFLAERVFSTLERFLHIEALSGIALIITAAAAMIWANSPAGDSYQAFWHAPLSIGFGDQVLSRPLHFWINDALMTVFFLVVGIEIRREIHQGALADIRMATLPLVAALGGVAVPALIYCALNDAAAQRQGWAIPTATDIAFAVGVLALLGRGLPSGIRVFLLTFAIIDDIAAVFIIAAFYSGGLDYSGLVIAAMGVLMVLGFQRIGIGSAWGYVLPGAILWLGLLKTGAHPTLAGVVLGLMTPVLPASGRGQPLDIATRAMDALCRRPTRPQLTPIRKLRWAQRELLPPVIRVQTALHPWVAFLVMPLFALANAGVKLDGGGLALAGTQDILLGIVLGLVLGKPLGIIGASWLAVRLGWCRLPADLDWAGVSLAALLGGIGFTMSIFVATLAFDDGSLLAAAKLGILLASLTAALLGLSFGYLLARRRTADERGLKQGR
ncbi:MAG: Na+/H+ antiporter NhaA [Porticoccaceae bacterium]